VVLLVVAVAQATLQAFMALVLAASTELALTVRQVALHLPVQVAVLLMPSVVSNLAHTQVQPVTVVHWVRQALVVKYLL